MNNFEQFIINFSGLKVGTYLYEYIIEDWFFERYDFSEVKKCCVKVNLSLDKQETMLVFKFAIDGYITVRCDRCSDYFDHPVKSNEQLVVKFGKERNELTEEILIISELEQQIDLSHYIYEYINLLLPMRRVHPINENNVSACDAEVVNRIGKISKEHNIDPRWEPLKSLINN